MAEGFYDPVFRALMKMCGEVLELMITLSFPNLTSEEMRENSKSAGVQEQCCVKIQVGMNLDFHSLFQVMD